MSYRELFGEYFSNLNSVADTAMENNQPLKAVQSYILVVPPKYRSKDMPMTQLAIQCESMDLNVSINSNMNPGNWNLVLDRHGQPKVWKKRNYITGRFNLTNCDELQKKGIDTCLRAGNKNVSTQSGWGAVQDSKGETHRIMYVHAVNFHKILQNGFFDKTASCFTKIRS